MRKRTRKVDVCLCIESKHSKHWFHFISIIMIIAFSYISMFFHTIVLTSFCLHFSFDKHLRFVAKRTGCRNACIFIEIFVSHTELDMFCHVCRCKAVIISRFISQWKYSDLTATFATNRVSHTDLLLYYSLGGKAYNSKFPVCMFVNNLVWNKSAQLTETSPIQERFNLYFIAKQQEASSCIRWTFLACIVYYSCNM